MQISIIGASKGVGFEAVAAGLRRGHQIVAMSRTPVQVEDQPNLRRVRGSARNSEALADAVTGSDAILVTLGQGQNIQPTTLFSDFTQTLLNLHQMEPIEVPVIILTGFGAGESLTYNSFFKRLVFKTILKPVYSDKNKMEQMISGSDLKWEIVRPGILTNEALTGTYRVEKELYTKMKNGHISRSDVADFMIKQAEKPDLLYRFPALFSK